MVCAIILDNGGFMWNFDHILDLYNQNYSEPLRPYRSYIIDIFGGIPYYFDSDPLVDSIPVA